MVDRSYASEFDRFVRIERPVAASGIRGAGSGTWELVDSVWAGIRDMPPSRGEQNGTTTRRSCVRMRYREDITSDMRVVDGARVLQFVTDAAELGRRAAIELMAEQHRPAGNSA